jgi:hypothetical protein
VSLELPLDVLPIAQPQVVGDREAGQGPFIQDLDAGGLSGRLLKGDIGKIVTQEGGIGGLASDLERGIRSFQWDFYTSLAFRILSSEEEKQLAASPGDRIGVLASS